jgi:hypothetical protein
MREPKLAWPLGESRMAAHASGRAPLHVCRPIGANARAESLPSAERPQRG